MAKAKLKFFRMTNDTSEVLTDTMLKQYDIDQKNLKIKKEKSKLDSKTAKALTGMALGLDETNQLLWLTV